jgi:N-formylglutamate deformylase
VPHCGVEFPEEVASAIRPRFVKNPEDTDWLVHELYDFAPELGVTVIHARYSRYVVDLNRDPSNRALYGDGRLETEVMPTRTFAGEPLYEGGAPTEGERSRRIAEYYDPYHARVDSLLAELKAKFGAALLYDAHSIRRLVPTIRPAPFSDMILGDQKGRTADPSLIETALAALQRGGLFAVAHNEPFQGGYLTRSFGRPERGIHALQVEMSQDVYLNDRMALDSKKTGPLREILRGALEALARSVTELGARPK